ncbi:MAG: TolC family protein, partial [Pseudomonadota bacterium]
RQVDVIWWRQFDDPVINELVQIIYADNLTLAIAQTRLSEAEALRGTVPSNLSITGDTAAIAQRDLQTDTTASGATADLRISWLFDPFQRQAASRALADNNVTLARAELSTARQVVLASLLNTYVDLRFQQARRANVAAEITRRRNSIAAQERNAAAGNSTEIELTTARAQVAARRTELPLIEAEISRLANQIAVLAGRLPGALDVDLQTRRQQPTPHGLPTTGVPSDLLRNRPDLFALEREYYAALLGVTQARADLYPRLSIGGTLSGSSIGADRALASFGPTLTLPSLPNGASRAAVDAAELRVLIAFDTWKEAVLSAVADAESAVISVQATARALEAASQSTALNRRALNQTQQVLNVGGATLSDITDAEDRVAAAEATQARLRQAYARAFIDLQVQLGSGEVLGIASPDQRTAGPSEEVATIDDQITSN